MRPPRWTFEEYVDSIGDARLVIDMLVGALQRLLIYPAQGFLVHQEVPQGVEAAYDRLCLEGFTSRLVPEMPDPLKVSKNRGGCR